MDKQELILGWIITGGIALVGWIIAVIQSVKKSRATKDY